MLAPLVIDHFEIVKQLAEVTALTRAFALAVTQSGVLLDHTLATAFFDTEGGMVETSRRNVWETREVLDAFGGGPSSNRHPGSGRLAESKLVCRLIAGLICPA